MEEYYSLFNSLKQENFDLLTTKIMEDDSVVQQFTTFSELYKIKFETKIDSKKLLFLYIVYFFPNETIEIHYPVLTYSRFTNVIKYTVEALNDYLLLKVDNTLFEYYWEHYTKMLKVWQEKDNFNLKAYLMYNFIHDKKDTILGLSKEDSGMYLLYDFWIEKKYKELYSKSNYIDDMCEIMIIIQSLCKINNFNITTFKTALEEDTVVYIQNIFDSVVDNLNMRLLDLYYISVKKSYLKNICCLTKTYVLFTVLAFIYFVPEINLKVGFSDKVNGWKNKLLGDQTSSNVEQG